MTPNISEYAAVSASSIFAVYVLVTLVKPLIELPLPPSHPLHNWAIRLCSCLFGVLIVFTATAVMHALVPETVYIAITQGVAAGLSAIGAYHLVNTEAPTTPVAFEAMPLESPPPQKLLIEHSVTVAPPPPTEPAPKSVIELPTSTGSSAVPSLNASGTVTTPEVQVPGPV